MKYAKKRVDAKKAMDYFVNNNGVAHIAYKASDINEIIDPHCVENYEILSDEFSGFLDKHLPYIKKNAPLVVEITGSRFTDEEKEKIENAIWLHFELLMATGSRQRVRMFIRLGCFILVLAIAILLSCFTNVGALAAEFISIGFWFCADSILAIVMDEYFSSVSTHARNAQLGSMKVIFTEEFEDRMFTDSEVSEIVEEIEENLESIEL